MARRLLLYLHPERRGRRERAQRAHDRDGDRMGRKLARMRMMKEQRERERKCNVS